MNATAPIPKSELYGYRADVKGEMFRQIRIAFHRLKAEGFTQKQLAERLGMDEGLLSRRMRGDNDMRLETLSDLARGLECRIDVCLTPLAEVVALNKIGRVPFSNLVPSETNSARVVQIPGGTSSKNSFSLGREKEVA